MDNLKKPAGRVNYSRLVDVSPDAIVSMSAEGRITLWNRSAERMFGYSRSEAIGMAVEELMPEELRARHAGGLRRFLSTEVPKLIGTTVEVKGRRKNNVEFPAELSLAAEKWEDTWNFTAIIRDITERVSAREQIERQVAELAESHAELSALYKVSSAISTTIDLDTLLEKIIDTVTGLEILKEVERHSVIFLVEEEHLVLGAHMDRSNVFLKKHESVKVGECLCGIAAETGEIVLSGDSDVDTRHTIRYPSMDRHGHVVVPLKAFNRVVGVLCLYVPVATVVEERTIELLYAIGSQLGVAINNALLYEQTKELSLHDPLTGLANRRLMYMELEGGVAKARRYGTHLSAVMCDFDDFKKYNDVHGHQAGDKLLTEAAAIIVGELRETDLVARYGGEEFLVLLPETDREGAAAVAERIRKLVEERSGATISMGVAACTADMRDGFDLVKKADSALYLAKKNGKNRVEVA